MTFQNSMYFHNTGLWLNTAIRTPQWLAIGLGVISLFLSLPMHGNADTNNMVGGTYANWPATWIAIPSLNDPVDAGVPYGRQDFIGDSNNPCGYWTADASYVYFRIRVNVTNAYSNTFSDSHFVMIDVIGSGITNVPDWAFVWDSQSSDNTRHGLELVTNNVYGTTWSAVKMMDVDGNSGNKFAPPDFGVSNGDGYVRTIGAVATTNFGLTTFIDIAASWSYLAANSGLRRGQTWRVQFASINNANDHNFISADIAANHNPSDANSLGYWSSSFTVGSSPCQGLLFNAR